MAEEKKEEEKKQEEAKPAEAAKPKEAPVAETPKAEEKPVEVPVAPAAPSAPAPAQTATPAPASAKKSRKGSILRWMIIVLIQTVLLAGMGIGGYVLGAQQNKKTVAKNQLVAVSPTAAQPSPLPTVDPAGVLKSFTDAKLGITFQYPSTFSLASGSALEASPSANEIRIETNSNTKNRTATQFVDDVLNEKSTSVPGKRVLIAITQKPEVYKAIKREKIAVGTIQAEKVSGLPGKTANIQVFIPIGTQMQQITFTTTAGAQTFNEQVDKILASMKITQQIANVEAKTTKIASESGTVPADWKTFTGKTLGFSIQYPTKIPAHKEAWEFEETENTVGFGTPSSKAGGYIWGVFVSEDKTMEELIKETGKQFSDRKETRKNITVNGKPAVFVTVTTNQIADWQSEEVYIQNKGKVYIIGNGAVVTPEFEQFYKSFKLL